MKGQRRPRFQLLTACVFLLILGAFSLAKALLPAPAVLQSERRKPAQLPKLSLSSLSSGSFMGGFEPWAADTFPFREGLRTLRAGAVFYLFNQADKGGLYLEDGAAGKFEALNEPSARDLARKIASLRAMFPADARAYVSVVPDKSLYAKRAYPGIDLPRLEAILREELPQIPQINLSAVLNAESYYRTDLHWDQSRLQPVVSALAEGMGFEAATDFKVQEIGPFSGVYAGQLALPLKPDEMRLLSSPALEGSTALYLNPKSLQMEPGEIYWLSAFRGQDPYDVFLGGVQPLIRIENPNAETDRELYLFRDSFSSSLVPLLAPSYACVTLIDLRYVDSRILFELIEPASDADLLFLYGSTIFNSASVLK
ncbi:MAG: hypothetical protein LBD02_03285 [Christensenellaceae bacterium]|jgi:hypothetical protein|nr:hypothetical protein [Christensenellaceae bacterium]